MSDAGLALGATLKKTVELGEWKTKRFDNLFYGSKYEQTDIDIMVDTINSDTTRNIKKVKYDDKLVAEHLNEGCIIGWFKGRFEFGPRALGARSILVRPTDAKTHQKLNKRLRRNEVMPFAPIVIGEKANDETLSKKLACLLLITYLDGVQLWLSGITQFMTRPVKLKVLLREFKKTQLSFHV